VGEDLKKMNSEHCLNAVSTSKQLIKNGTAENVQIKLPVHVEHSSCCEPVLSPNIIATDSCLSAAGHADTKLHSDKLRTTIISNNIYKPMQLSLEMHSYAMSSVH